MQLSPELEAWLCSDGHDVEGWAPDPPLATLHCRPDLVQRLTEVARPIRDARRAWIDGSPVVHHGAGPPIACARGTSLLVVRSGLPAGALAADWNTTGLTSDWVDVDPWAADVTFATTTELLRMHVQRAYDLAEARAWR